MLIEQENDKPPIRESLADKEGDFGVAAITVATPLVWFGIKAWLATRGKYYHKSFSFTAGAVEYSSSFTGSLGNTPQNTHQALYKSGEVKIKKLDERAVFSS